MSYGRSNYSTGGYDRDYSRYSREDARHYSSSYEGDYSEPKYGRLYSKNNSYEHQCNCCHPVYPQPQPICPPRPHPCPTPWPPIVGPDPATPTSPTSPTGGITSAYASAFTAIPVATGTLLAAATPLRVSFNAPNTFSRITVDGAIVTFTNPGTYYVEFAVPVTTTAATGLTIDAITTPGTATASPSAYTLALPSGLNTEIVSYKGFVTVPAGGTVSFTLTSSSAGTRVSQGQLTTFRVA